MLADLTHLFQTHFLLNFQSSENGYFNLIIPILLTTLLLKFTTALFQSHIYMRWTYFWYDVYDIVKKYWKNRTGYSVTIIGKEFNDSRFSRTTTEYPKEMKALLYYISKTHDIKGLKDLRIVFYNDREMMIFEEGKFFDELATDMKDPSEVTKLHNYQPFQITPFVINSSRTRGDIVCTCTEKNSGNKTNENSSGDSTSSTYIVERQLTISSEHSRQHITDFITKLTKDFEDEKQRRLQNMYFYLKFVKSEDNKMIYDESPLHSISSICSFDALFFPQKQELLTHINAFLQNKSQYIRLGIPHRLGILFTGIPGCGKTSCIKAIMRKLHDEGKPKNLIDINLNRVKTCRDLDRLFFDRTRNSKDISVDNSVLLMEDIDCMSDVIKRRAGMKEITKSKSKTKSKTQMKHHDEIKADFEKLRDNEELKSAMGDKMEMLKTFMMIESSPSSYDTDDKVTLSYLLNLLDGVNENTGRILIMTTNCVDDIDPALIRPGRIDIVIDFKKMTPEDLISMYEYYYQTEFPPELTSHVPANTFTPAQVTGIFKQNLADPIQALENLFTLSVSAEEAI